MYNPVSTYRLQFNKDFTLEDFEKIIPYLHRLGIGTVYASPVFEATPGSVHGYDGVDPNAINPEIGSKEKLYALSKMLRECAIGWLQDIVPNHMAFHSDNEWFMDVLEKGRRSEFASFFDVSWTGRLYHGRIMVPFLGARLEEVLRNRELSIALHNGRLALKYFDSYYPLRPVSYAAVLRATDAGDENILSRLESIEDEIDFAETWTDLRADITAQLADRAREKPQELFDGINNDPAALKHIADQQYYQLCHWQETDRKINFRRFFTVNSLICLNIHRPEVFRQYHALVKELVEAQVFQGLRVDHIDGLYDPTNYLAQLRELAGEESYIVVEKILGTDENLPELWPVQGNTGYDFLAMVNNLFTDNKSKPVFSDFYRQLTGDRKSIREHLHDKKSHILYHHMSGELENLYQLFMRSELIDAQEHSHIHAGDIKTAIAEFLVCCPVYRYYGDHFPLSDTEATCVQKIFAQITEARKELIPAVQLLEKVIIEKPQQGHELYNTRVLRFYQRCMQFTGPLMAKGVEDTLMYTYNRFIAHNDVGDSPAAFGCTPEEFHTMMKHRRRKWPLSLNATSTHDTKRGEDVRARLNVLSDIPGEWFARVDEWRRMNAELKHREAPDANDEYFLYQTLAGAYPMPGAEGDFPERIEQYIEKALREAKTHSDWATPDTAYEEATKAFVRSLLDAGRPFMQSFSAFHKKITDFGIVNSLSQLVLRFACPGVPDTYQGTELWDLSLVDPDNRRPVDYALREKFLTEVLEKNSAAELWDERYSGGIKLRLVHTMLHLRREFPDLFAEGEYIPLKAGGEFGAHIFSFARRHEHRWLLIAVPLHPAQICSDASDIMSMDWKGTHIILPHDTQILWQDVFFHRTISGPTIAIADLFAGLPFAVLPGCE